MSRRVLMTADAVGGVWTYALELARALAADEVTVMLAVRALRHAPAKQAAAYLALYNSLSKGNRSSACAS